MPRGNNMESNDVRGDRKETFRGKQQNPLKSVAQ